MSKIKLVRNEQEARKTRKPEHANTSEEDAAAAQKMREERERLLSLDRRISENRINLIEDEKEKQIALVKERMENEIADAKYGEEEKKKIRTIAALEIKGIELDAMRKKNEEAKRIEENAAGGLRDLKISMIENEYDRRRAEIAATETDEIAAANGVWPAIQAAMEKRKLAEQKLANDKAKAQGEANKDWGYEAAELELELQYKGLELEREKLKLKQKQAMEAAKAAGLDTEALEKLQGLQMQVLDLNNRPSNDLSSMGTFSSMNVSQMLGMGGGTFDRIAKATEQTAKNTAKPGSVPAWQ